MQSLRWMWLLAAIGIWPSNCALADLIVDNFTTPQSVPNSGGVGVSAPGLGIFGGSRLLNMQVINATQQLDIANQLLNLTANAVVPANANENTMTLTYNDATPSEDMAVENAFAVSLADVQATASWTLTVSFSGTNSLDPAVRTLSIADGFNGDLVIPFSSFNNSVTGLGPLSRISLHFVNQNSATSRLSSGPITLLTTTAVPEPSVMVLAALSLGGVVLRRRKRVRR